MLRLTEAERLPDLTIALFQRLCAGKGRSLRHRFGVESTHLRACSGKKSAIVGSRGSTDSLTL
ncbi:hypothetical protein [Ignatzschineria cameli]|uniref:hypothetical protein n=1 Tax=Ignatzschineria cameli TaxID=2182793 RepID=UPI0010582F4C|nr:hypothetical protein [Ignatzschineria cameli]